MGFMDKLMSGMTDDSAERKGLFQTGTDLAAPPNKRSDMELDDEYMESFNTMLGDEENLFKNYDAMDRRGQSDFRKTLRGRMGRDDFMSYMDKNIFGPKTANVTGKYMEGNVQKMFHDELITSPDDWNVRNAVGMVSESRSTPEKSRAFDQGLQNSKFSKKAYERDYPTKGTSGPSKTNPNIENPGY